MSRPRRIAVMMDLDHAFKRHVGVFAGIHGYARRHSNWRLVVDEWADHSLPSRAGQKIPYDGIVGRIGALGARRARRWDVPVVNVWFSSPAKGLPGVFADHRASGQLVAEHLFDRGFRNLGALVHDFDAASLLQAQTMEQIAGERGFGDRFRKLVLSRVVTHRDWRRSVQAIERWMDTWQLPVGMLIREANQARLVIELASARGWSTPDDMAIVCSYNDEFVCEHPEPSLTSVGLDDEQCGYEAAQLLDRLIDAQQNEGLSPFAHPKTILLPPKGIVARHSTDFFAVADPLVREALRFIAQHLDKPLDVNRVARKLNVSRRTLYARFQAKLGKTVAGEIQRLRIERVKRDLVGSSLPIYKIARQAGFASTRTLNDQFQRSVGISPGAYRKENAPARSSPATVGSRLV